MNEKRKKDFKQLRQKFDSSDLFVAGGHRIKQVRQGNRPIPEWVNDREKIQAFLLRSFPRLKTDFRQRERAGRWARVIQLYFRQQMTHGQIRYELGRVHDGKVTPVSLNNVKMIIRAIKKAVEGKRANGTGDLSNSHGRPKGRKDTVKRTRGPNKRAQRKSRDTIAASSERSPRRGDEG